MCTKTDHLEWHLDVYWRCVLRQYAATLITLNENLMSIGGVYYVNVQQHWSPWMTSWCLMEVCTTSMCSNIDHLNWELDVYWRVCTTAMSSNTDHLEWHLDVYWRCVLHQCSATLITFNDILMSIEGVYYVNVQQHWSPWLRPWCLLEGVYYVNVQQHWSPWMASWCLLEVCITSMW
jgi:metal-sulfur cluster biosynthetic enzyme